MKTLLKIWKDPVWSKVIAGFIISIGAIFYKDYFIKFLTFKIDVWIILIIVPIIIFIESLLRKKRKEIKTVFEYDMKTLSLDISLFNKIRNYYLSQSNINWLKYQDFTRSFYSTKLEPFHEFLFESNNADFEFLNPDLENLKLILIENIENLESAFSRYLFPSGISTLSIPNEWKIEDFERYCNAIDNINTLVIEVNNDYHKFIKHGRKILKV